MSEQQTSEDIGKIANLFGAGSSSETTQEASEVNHPPEALTKVPSSPEVFDPLIHETDKTGQPVPKVGGGFRLKRGNAKVAAKLNKPRAWDGKRPAPAKIVIPKTPDEAEKEAETQEKQKASEEAIRANRLELARASVETGTAALATLLGPDWNAETKELENLAQAMARWQELHNFGDPGPDAGFALQIARYALPRFQTKTTQSRLKLLWEAIKAKFVEIRERGFKFGR